VIRDDSMFEKEMVVNGVKTNVIHPSKMTDPNEKWIDLRGD
jgi:hypothetical protein